MFIVKDLNIKLVPINTTPNEIRYGYVKTEFGRIMIGKLGVDGIDAVCLLYFVCKSDADALKEARNRWPKSQFRKDQLGIESWYKDVLIFEEGSKISHNSSILIAVRGTAFQIAVYTALIHVRTGWTRTYSELALMAGRPKAVRAAARAVGLNEVSLLIPCHRIVSKNGDHKYHWGSQLKKKLLSIEEMIYLK